jgi:hypothetical protein
VTPEQEEFLQDRLREAISKQPDLERLNGLLLQFGGEFLVAPRKPDPDIPSLLKQGRLMSGPVMLSAMKSSSCHQNVASLWRKQELGLIGIATGYALSEDGLWRQHSWGILRDGVLETTATRLKYFGVVLEGERADFFAKCHYTT